MVMDMLKGAAWLLGPRLAARFGHLIPAAQMMAHAAENHVRKPGGVRDRLDGMVNEWQDRMARRNVRDCHEQADDGELLLEIKAAQQRFGWPLMLRRLHITKKTFTRRVAIHLLRKHAPAAFEKLARLGPDRLYEIAILPVEARFKVDLEDSVATPRGPVKLRWLTDDELADYHERECKPYRAKKPDFWHGIDDQLRLLEKRVARKGAHGRPPRPTLAALLARTRVLSVRIEGFIQGVA